MPDGGAGGQERRRDPPGAGSAGSGGLSDAGGPQRHPLHRVLRPGGEGQRPPALGGRPVLLHGGAGAVQDGGHHHDRHGPGRRGRAFADAEGRGVYHRAG